MGSHLYYDAIDGRKPKESRVVNSNSILKSGLGLSISYKPDNPGPRTWPSTVTSKFQIYRWNDNPQSVYL